ncbi:MAG: hypothetical protein HYW57_04665 [Ignavibacteriales bacterium]|nr:hypothetical protein [Ignavibacteriales bacterium]
MTDVVQTARRLLRLLSEESRGPATADELLLFLYRLKDEASVLRSKSGILSGASFSSLGAIIYELESRPDETLDNPDQREFLRTLLTDLKDGTILVKPR